MNSTVSRTAVRRARRASAPSFVACAALLGALFVAPREAAAQQLGGFALDQFDPAPAGDPFFGVPSPQTPGRLTPRFGVAFDYARQPLRVGTGAIVADQGFLHVGASLALVDRLLIDVNMPVALLQSGDDPRVNGVTLTSPSGAHAGDLRLGMRVRLLGDYYDPFQLAIGAELYLPTAGDGNFDGDGAVRVRPELLVGGRAGSDVGFVYSATGGAMVKASNNPALFTFGAGAALTFFDDALQIGPELLGAQQVGSGAPLQGPKIKFTTNPTNLEVLGGAKLRVLGGLVLGAAGGPGIADGVGTPKYRIVGSVAWAPEPARVRGPADDDEDGIPNSEDACPKEKGIRSDDPKKNGCPPPDRDGDGIPDQFDACPDQKGRASDDPTINGCPADYDRDGIPDSEDACPNQKGVRSADPKKNGCPGEVDTDGDGIPDKEDACPRVKGVASADPARNGCPIATAGDRDGDGIPDSEDACPDERGRPDPDPKKNGCPVGPRVFDAPSVHFEFGSDQLGDGANGELQRVKAAIDGRSDVAHFEVQGNSDEVGDPGFNQALSQRRARAVTNWLTAHGVAARRLSARGYGATRPLSGPNPDEQHRLNRRVDVVILDKK